jgi:hypothetical protein
VVRRGVWLRWAEAFFSHCGLSLMIHPGSLYYCLSTMQSLKPDAPQFSDIFLQ